MDLDGLQPADRAVEGLVARVLDATRNNAALLTSDRLYAWHGSLFPSGGSGLVQIRTGAWRSDERGPMQVVSGAIARERVHFQAPPADRVDMEMTKFLRWFVSDFTEAAAIRAGIAHLWFVTIHPFDDGNGRIGRAILDMSLARAEREPRRLYSMSRQIERVRREYYSVLEHTQKGSMDVTAYLAWFLE
jgi:Fic family protein